MARDISVAIGMESSKAYLAGKEIRMLLRDVLHGEGRGGWRPPLPEWKEHKGGHGA
jgi:hypothetical protein